MEPVKQITHSPISDRVWATPDRGELQKSATRPDDSYVAVGQLLSQCQATSPVRNIVEAVLAGNTSVATSNLALFSALANGATHQWREQVVAAWALGRVTLDSQERDAAAGMLLDNLERDESESAWERFLRGLFWGYGIMFPVSLIVSILLCSGDGRLEWADVFPKLLFTLGSFTSVFTAPFCLIYGHVEQSRQALLRAASAEALGRLRVIESIGPLAEALFDTDPTVNEAAASALLQILPQLTEEDYGLISHHSLRRLTGALAHPNSLVVFKVLEALRKIGTGSALPAVERLVRDGKTRNLQETARQVVAVLEERRRREKESLHLIRATAAPAQSGDELLHTFTVEDSSGRRETDSSASHDGWL